MGKVTHFSFFPCFCGWVNVLLMCIWLAANVGAMGIPVVLFVLRIAQKRDKSMMECKKKCSGCVK